jgi:hypothetical protein
VAGDKPRAQLDAIVERLRARALTLDEALTAVGARDLVRRADNSYFGHANQQAHDSLYAREWEPALVWATAAKEVLDYLRPPQPKELLIRVSKRITAAGGFDDRFVAYSEYAAGVAAFHLGRYEQALASLRRAKSLRERVESRGFTVADCSQLLAQIPQLT